MSSVVGSRVGQNNKIVAAFVGDLSYGTGDSGFGTGSNGLHAWLPSDVDVFAASGEIRRYVVRQDDSAVAGAEANSGLTYEPDTTPTLVGPRKTSVGPQIVLVFNPRSL